MLGNLGLARLFIWSAFGYVTFKEFYLYACEDPRAPTNVQPEYIWLGFMAAVLENYIEVKWFMKGQVAFTGGMPLPVIVSWTIVLSLVFGRWSYLKFVKNAGTSNEKVAMIFKEKDE